MGVHVLRYDMSYGRAILIGDMSFRMTCHTEYVL